MAINLISLLSVIGGFVSLAALIWITARGDSARDQEDAARAFFDRHGRWPDERH